MTRKLVPWLAAVLLVVWAAGVPAAPVISDANLQFRVLDNGLRVVVKEEHTWPVVTIGMYVKAGSLYEAPDQIGAAHLIEHLLFEAEGGDSEARVAQYIEGIGGRMSAFTGRDFTHVDITIASDQVETALGSILSTVLEARFDEAAVAHEQMVVAREIAEVNESALGLMDMVLWQNAFASHPYRNPIGGTAEAVRALTISRIRDFYSEFYVPNNMSLLVVGRVDADWFFRRVERLTAAHKSQPVQWRVPAPETVQTEVRRQIITRDSELSSLAYAWHAPGMPDKDEVCATDLIYTLLGQGQTGRLYQTLVKDNQWAAAIDVSYLTQRCPGLFTVSVAVQGANEMAVRKAVLEQTERLVHEPVTEEELARAKLLLKTEYAFHNESYAGQVGSMGFYESIDTYEFAVEYTDRINAISAEQIQAVAGQIFRPDSYTLVVLRRQKDQPPTQEVRSPWPALALYPWR